MSNNEKSLRQQFAADKPRLLAKGASENIKSPDKLTMYAIEKGGYIKVAANQTENVAVDQKKINRLNTNANLKTASRQYGN